MIGDYLARKHNGRIVKNFSNKGVIRLRNSFIHFNSEQYPQKFNWNKQNGTATFLEEKDGFIVYEMPFLKVFNEVPHKNYLYRLNDEISKYCHPLLQQAINYAVDNGFAQDRYFDYSWANFGIWNGVDYFFDPFWFFKDGH